MTTSVPIATPTRAVRAFAPGRVNLIGDHTDYTGGWCLPIALQWGTTVTGSARGDRIQLTSSLDDTTVDLPLVGSDASTIRGWGRYVAAVIAEFAPTIGFIGRITTTLPVGAGLSSSAAFEIALLLALGFDDGPLALAQAAQRAEHAAVGVPCGIMDQLTSAMGRHDHALLIDCNSLEVLPVEIPQGAEIRVIDSGQPRQLDGSPYAERRAACTAAQAQIGPLHLAGLDAINDLSDPVLRRRARHVITENQRVMTAAKALRRGDWEALGDAMFASHRSLRDDFEVSTDLLDQIVGDLAQTPGVYGARLTGAGFGGCIVALCEPGALSAGSKVVPSNGARVFADVDDQN